MNGIRCHLREWKDIHDAVYVRYYAETILFKEFRSKSNDEKILSYIIDCSNKEKLEQYVDEKIRLKFGNI
jgi:hypothetical protein